MSQLTVKIGPNDRCPCGSGLKFKKCCRSSAKSVGYTTAERASASTKLEDFIGDEFGQEDDQAFEEFWGQWLDHPDGLDQGLDAMSEQVADGWFAFDCPLESGQMVVDCFLEKRALRLTEGEKRYLNEMKASSMRLYEIEDSRPGESLTLRDVIEGDWVTVQERLGSRSLHQFEWIAARVVKRGASGGPELEGLLQITDFFHEGLRTQLRKERERFFQENPGATAESFYKEQPPLFHDVWAGSILEPHVPKLANTDGDEMVVTCVLFDVLDPKALATALEGVEGLSRDEVDGPVWQWDGKNAKGEPIILGHLRLKEQTLTLETNSVARGDRGRALVESSAGSAVKHRATSHEDLQRRVREELKRSRDTDTEGSEDSGKGKNAIPFEVQEALVLDHQARHYRKWMDEPVPMLDDQTPRAAAKDRALRPKLEELLRDLDLMYQRSLVMGQPAFDASWLWDELGLEEAVAPHPPPLAAQRVAQLVPGSAELSRSVAEELRRQPGFDDASTVLSEEAARTRLELQRFLKDRPVASTTGPQPAAQSLATHLRLMVNFDLHRRKSFWVDEALAYMLAQTELDVLGSELRVPFPSFAIVFTDRHVLSLGERLVARDKGCPLVGHHLRVATVFVTEAVSEQGRTLEVTFAFDALGADLPFLVTHLVPLKEDEPVEALLDALAPAAVVSPEVPNANPLRGLLQVAVNAILYATSAGVAPEVRATPAGAAPRPRVRGGPPVSYSSDEVYFLPGAIEISQVRRMQELDRIPAGRSVLRRFMVRGHWRRPSAKWTDHHMRWIQPYWKGPDMATIIERTYKLKP